MLFQYVGDKAAPEKTVIYGKEFTLHGDPVDVTDQFVIKKLKGNCSFIEVSSVAEIKPKVTLTEITQEETKVETFDIPVEEDLS